MTILACNGCRRTKPEPTGDPTDLFPSEHCGDCPPWTCETCGETCSAAALCSCWVSFDGMTTADIKALLAADADAAPEGAKVFEVNPVIEP
ncbi:hypothetical protein ABZ725_14230 [Streptomyces sp. NPDC006872]|uniref:hypothetical protein n=1 Tax=Streptomyces sp. NPDC006872 TaxID=3155720 RepID=UPI0033FA802C